jgi:hypothetical protein
MQAPLKSHEIDSVAKYDHVCAITKVDEEKPPNHVARADLELQNTVPEAPSNLIELKEYPADGGLVAVAALESPLLIQRFRSPAQMETYPRYGRRAGESIKLSTTSTPWRSRHCSVAGKLDSVGFKPTVMGTAPGVEIHFQAVFEKWVQDRVPSVLDFQYLVREAYILSAEVHPNSYSPLSYLMWIPLLPLCHTPKEPTCSRPTTWLPQTSNKCSGISELFSSFFAQVTTA